MTKHSGWKDYDVGDGKIYHAAPYNIDVLVDKETADILKKEVAAIKRVTKDTLEKEAAEIRPVVKDKE